jgi:hypothetical protein
MICRDCAQDADNTLPPPTCAICGRTVAYARPGSDVLSRHRAAPAGRAGRAPWCAGRTAAPRGHAACTGWCDCQHRGARR